MKHTIDLDNWNRREHFRFFSAFDDPFWGTTTLVDFSNVYLNAKREGLPFFLASVHFILKCVNLSEPFRLRIEEGGVVSYDTINLSPTIGRDDGTFGFGLFEYHPELKVFIEGATKEIERVRNASGLNAGADGGRKDLIRYSALPWFAFTEMKHAVSFGRGDSVPRISTGKLTKEGGKYLLPVSVCVHHGLVDGRDVGELVKLLSGE